jgi:UDP-N-acetylmuramate dehydrogenase
LEYPSVGSFFKRPEGYFAAKLIEDSGLKGFSVGGAQVSEKHSGFVINKGGATTKDILELSKHVKKTVYDKFGVTLEEEVRVLNSVAETDIE